MDNLLQHFDDGVREFGRRVDSISSDEWAKPTPDTEWNVEDLVRHLIDEHLWMPPLLGGHDLETAGKIVEGTTSSGNGAVDWTAASAASLQSVREPGALERMVSLSRGPTPAEQYVTEMVLDLAIHSWDLGKALGIDNSLPDSLVAFVYPIVEGAQEMLASSGMFADPVPVPDDASELDKLIALTGRDPR